MYLILMLAPVQTPVKKVVQVDAITLAAVTPKPEGGHAGGSGAPPAPEPPKTVAKPPPPPKPQAPKPKPVVKPPPPPIPDPEPIPPRLALPRPAPPAAPARPTSTYSSIPNPSASGSGSGSGTGTGSGSGEGAGVGSGRGYGSGSGLGTGTGAGSGAALQGYLSRVRSLLERNKIYPQQARSRNEQGTVVVRFTINADGSIGGVSLSKPSGHSTLDQAAQETVNRVGRFPPLPGELQKNSLTVQVPLAYRLHGG